MEIDHKKMLITSQSYNMLAFSNERENSKILKLRREVFEKTSADMSSMDLEPKAGKTISVFSHLVDSMTIGYASQLFSGLEENKEVFIATKFDFPLDLVETTLRNARKAYSNPDDFEFVYILQHYLDTFPIHLFMKYFVKQNEKTKKAFLEMVAKCWLAGFFLRDELNKFSNAVRNRDKFNVVDGGKEQGHEG